MGVFVTFLIIERHESFKFVCVDIEHHRQLPDVYNKTA